MCALLGLTLVRCACVLAQRFDENGHPEYKVRWSGYDSTVDQWLPLSEVAGCHRMLKEFEARLQRAGVQSGEEPLHQRLTKSI
jgi:hypothetical protein